MPVRSLKTIPIFVWIPPQYSPINKIEVIRSNGTVDDITDLITNCEVEDGITETIGRFEFEIWDPNETYVNAWSGNETFRYYSDYATTATTKTFQGKVEKVSKQGLKLKVTGRSESLSFMEITVTKQYVNTECSLILKALIDAYSTGFTYVNVNTSAVSLSVNWYQKPFWEAVQELCTAAQFDAYVDKDKDFHFFATGSVNNANEAIVHDMNMIEIGDFANDISQVKNRIIVYGAEQEGVQIVYTAEDTSSQVSYGIKEEIINDSNITNYNQAQQFGDFQLSQKKDPPIIGEIKGILLGTIQPGERIQLSSPEDGINPGYYDILSYVHKLPEYTTAVRVSKEPRKISHIFKDIIEASHKKEQTYINPHEMRYSYNFLFNEDSGTHSTTEITNGVLKLSSGSSGNWISNTRLTTSNVAQVYIIANGETLTGATFDVSADGGINYDTNIPLRTLKTLTSTGKTLRIKVNFTNADTQIDSASILYKY